MAEWVAALASGPSVHKTWGFESLYPHHSTCAPWGAWRIGPNATEGRIAVRRLSASEAKDDGQRPSPRKNTWREETLTKAPDLHQVRPILGTGLRIFAAGDIWQREALTAG